MKAREAVEQPESQAPSCILLVDDHDGVRDATAMLLRVEGFEVLSAASLTEANRLLRESPRIDLVIADYHLQRGETGLDVIAAARAIAGNHLGAILMSGDVPTVARDAQSADRLRLAGKPIRAQELLSTIRELLLRERP